MGFWSRLFSKNSTIITLKRIARKESIEDLITLLHEKHSQRAADKLEELRREYKNVRWNIEDFPHTDADKSTEQGKTLAFLVGLCNFCPNCNTESIHIGPRGGVSANMVCSECGARYWMTDPEWAYANDLRVLMAFGAYILNYNQIVTTKQIEGGQQDG